MQRLENGHGDHRRAVGVGHDALRDVVEGVGVDLRHHKRNVGVHAPRRRVVDHDGAGFGHARSQSLGSRAARGEQGDVQSAVGGGLGVLDLDVLAVPREVATR